MMALPWAGYVFSEILLDHTYGLIECSYFEMISLRV